MRSVAAVCALFAALATAAIVAQRRCQDYGGRVSEAAWSCETGQGAVASLWTFVSPEILGLAALAVGIPVYWIVNFLGQRWLARAARPPE